MDPNSKNQEWAEWHFTVTHAPEAIRHFEEVKTNVARFMRHGFGSAAQMKMTRRRARSGSVVWEFTIQAEGSGAVDKLKRSYMLENVARFMTNGFGPSAETRLVVKLLAGPPDNGKPASQWLIMPEIKLLPNLWGDKTQQLGMPAIPPTSKTILGKAIS